MVSSSGREKALPNPSPRVVAVTKKKRTRKSNELSEPALGGVESLDEMGVRTGERVPGAEGVARTGDEEELRGCGGCRGAFGEAATLVRGHALVRVAVHEEPWCGAARGRGQDVQLGAVGLEVLQQAEAEGEPLAGARVDHGELAVAPPGLFLLRGVAVETGH